MYSDDDQRSFSLVSISGIETIQDLTEQDTDEFELIHRDQHAESSRESTSSKDSTSVPPDLHAHEFEHGRQYHSYKSGRYPLPNDIGEQDREEIAHALMLQLMDGKLFLSDIGESPQKIIDIGTGTGTWAIDVADLYPSASVVGTDLSPIQPRWMPINARMFVEDCEDPEWMHGCGFDLVHLRGVAGVLLDLDAVVANAYCNIVNGGWIEFQEFDPLVICDDGTMEEDDKVREFGDICARGIREYGCPAYGKQDLRRTLEHAGFQRIQVVTKQVPISAWSPDKKLKIVGSLMKANILEALDGFAAKPLAALGMSVKERRDLVADVRESLDDNWVHRYINCHFCYGQKDEQKEEMEETDSDSGP
ncbi:S-adenosyl-L-methionine-dependent methyltransferase [Dactylonectria estremocensis]|uniref:S-adenosyl-L-methionine-dependent methyltransferase n=1 Tax=Dactylonectria estremocensis TaxID=1079267 RepID=A0A9P9F4H7_9HYPO|nr:S-adenosyl-L-methionine-dependent methyltransferase [Dactylonectria estremocensis]